MAKVQHRLSKALLLVFVVFGGILVVLAFPYLASAYHLETGARAIRNPETLTSDRLQAMEHLQKALEWEPNNAQAYRLLGKIYREQEDWSTAAEALVRYTELRPSNPLGHLELAEVYEAMLAQTDAAEAQELGTKILEEWNRAGLKVQDFVNAGEQAREAKEYDQAMVLFQRALQLETNSGDPWYYIGRVYEDQKLWLQALDAYEQATITDSFRQIHRSSPHYRAGRIYQKRLDPQQPDKALAAFDTALAVDDFGSEAEAADCHYRKAQILRSQKANHDEFIAEFQQAITLDPEHVAAHLWLGIAIYQRDQDGLAAEAELLRALELDPGNRTVYYQLGEVYRQEGRVDEAVTMYENALAIDPDYKAARKRLKALGGEE